MSKRPTKHAQAGRAARQAVDALAEVLDACGHPDGARLRAALAALDQLAPKVATVAADPHEAAARILEAIALKARARRLTK